MTKTTPKISLGLPVYNGEQFITHAIDSILDQTFDDFELIICDNASTDQTPEIVKKYAKKDSRIRFYRQKLNVGATNNFMRTLELAKGEYFKWIATDDVITVDFLQNCINILDKRPDVLLVYSKSAFINAKDEILYLFDDVLKIEEWSYDPVLRMRQHLSSVMHSGSAANVFIFGLARTEVLKKIQPMGNYFGCDFVFTADIFLYGNVYEHPQLMSFYRRHGGSSSTYSGTPSAKKQQQFYDPGISGFLKVHFQLRRRYFELFRTIFTSNLNEIMKIQVLMILFQLIAWRIGWRLKYEYETRFTGSERKVSRIQPELIGQTWQEIAYNQSKADIRSQVST